MPTSFYEKEHIPGAENIPLTIFDFIYDLTLADADKEKEIIVYGRSISRHYDEAVANKYIGRDGQGFRATDPQDFQHHPCHALFLPHSSQCVCVVLSHSG